MRISTRFEEYKRYNRRTGHWRIAWRSFSAKEQLRSYNHAIRAFKNGVRNSHPGTFQEFAAFQAALDRYQPAIVRPRTTRTTLPPAIFGSVARTQILQLLAANGPLHVRQIARLRNCDSASTFRSVTRLIAAGVVVKRDVGRRVVALDRSHRGYPQLKQCLAALSKAFPVPVLRMPRYRHGLPEARDAHRVPDELNLFGQRAQTCTLLAVAAVGRINVADLARALQTTHIIVWHATNGLERRGLVASKRIGCDRIVMLNEQLPASAALCQYLRKLIESERPEYDDIKRLLAAR